MRFINEIIKEDYRQWSSGDLIFINAGTGRGKTYFIKNKLNTYCQKNNKKILYLTNRDNLKQQVKNDIGENSNITVMNYQKIEQLILENVRLNNYDYVISDEAHYFFTDAAFNRKTDLFFKQMLKDKSVCKVLMTATPLTILHYFKQKNIKIDYKYELKTDYSYLNKIICYSDHESINGIIEDIPQNEQIILFSTAKRSLEIAQKYKATFICSKFNKDGLWDKYIKGTKNEEELGRIIQTGKFNNHLLCCTTALDNGVNIKESTPVRHIIIDIFDRDSFIQCLGRKRVSENEKVNLYFYGWNNRKKLNGLRTKIVNSIKRADFLREQGELEYVRKKFKADIYDSKMIDEIIGDDGKIHKIINECMYQKFYVDKLILDTILDKKYSNSFKNIISIALDIKNNEIIDMETTLQEQSLEEFLDSIVGIKLFKEQQKILKQRFEEYGLKARTLGINTLNGYIKDKKLSYIITKGKRKSVRSRQGKIQKEKSHWIIGKITYT